MGSWLNHYTRAAYVDMAIGHSSGVEDLVREEAATHGWVFAKLTTSLVLWRKLVHGDWGDDFLVPLPGGRIAITYDETCMQLRGRE